MKEPRLKVGDLVRYADGRFSKSYPNDVAIIVEMFLMEPLDVNSIVKLYWQQAMQYDTEYVRRLVKDEDYPIVEEKKENK